jgi:probable HAF family extracellular repeat protein
MGTKISLVVVIAAHLAAYAASASVEYTVQLIAPPPGYGNFIEPTAMNDHGDFVGAIPASAGATQYPFVYSNGTINVFSNVNGIATGINNNGQIVGGTTTKSNSMHAFLYSSGVLQDLGTLGGSFSKAWGINDSGSIVGQAEGSDGASRPFLYDGNTMAALTPQPGRALAISSNGKVTGSFSPGTGGSDVFLYDGALTNLGSLPGASSDSGAGLAINGNGDIVGEAAVSNDGQTHAFIYSQGKMTDLGALGLTNAGATGINDLGQVVGFAYGNTLIPFIYSNGTMTDLRSVIDPSLGLSFESIADINDNGQILAQVMDQGGNVDAAVLTPVPEPTSAIAIIAVASCLFMRPRYRVAL